MLRNVVAVIGAGPAGCSTAIRLKRLMPQLEVVLYEQRPAIGKRECGEAVSRYAFDENSDILGKYGREYSRYIARNVNEIIWKIGNNEKIIKAEGCMIYRPAFNSTLTEIAEVAGVELRTDSTVVPERKLPEGWKIRIKTSEREYDKICDVIVAADGASSATALKCGLITDTEHKLWFRNHALGYQIKTKSSFSKEPLIFDFTSAEDPGIEYHYAFYHHNGVSNFGFLTTKQIVSKDFFKEENDRWIKRLGVDVHDVIDEVHQHIPIGGPIPKTYGDGILVVGDAAGHTNPITGGGVHAALEGGKIAAKTIAKAYEVGDVGEAVLKAYEDAWKTYPFASDVLFRGKYALRRLREGQKLEERELLDYAECLDVIRVWGW
jgi:digeranylgeranylglycerophospholipid reductase